MRVRDLQCVWSTTRLHINAREAAHLEGFTGGQCERWRESVLGKSSIKYLRYKRKSVGFLYLYCIGMGYRSAFLVARVYATHRSLNDTIRSMTVP